MLAKVLPSGWRIVRRDCTRPKTAESNPRLAWLNPYHAGDVWIAQRGSELLELFFNQHSVTGIRATALDQISLNEIVYRLRTHRPRRRIAG